MKNMMEPIFKIAEISVTADGAGLLVSIVLTFWEVFKESAKQFEWNEFE